MWRRKSVYAFLLGALCMLVLAGTLYMWRLHMSPAAVTPDVNTATPSVPPGTVLIKPLEPLHVLADTNRPFRGKKEFPLVIAGKYARYLIVANFQATGENAGKSVMEITWEDGTKDTVPAGTADRHFSPEKRAVKIVIFGYSMHERTIFPDTSQPGTLTWRVLYEPVAE